MVSNAYIVKDKFEQAMMLLPDGIVAVTNIIGESSGKNVKEIADVKSFLSEMKSQLIKLGYKLIEIDTSINNIFNHQFFINSIPYIDKKTEQKMMIMPVPHQQQTLFNKQLIRKNISVFESVGYRVVTVPSEATDFKGGIHCLVNVIE